MRIENSEGFGMAFNCIIRLYRENYNKELLALLHRICDEYLVWFHLQTIFCAIRDLMRDKCWIECCSMPEEQRMGLELLQQRLVRQYIILEYSRCESEETKEEALCEFGQQAGFTPGVYSDVRFQSFEEFKNWIAEKHLDDVSECRVTPNKKTFPIKKSFLQDFGKICFLMIQYSVGRKTHVRYVCYTFVYHNVRLLEGKMIIKIQNYVKNIKEDGNKAYWENIESILEKEIQRRRLFKLYAHIYKNKKMLHQMLAGCISADILVSYEECQEAQWRIAVFEEFLKGQKMDEQKMWCQKFIENAKRIIVRELERYTETYAEKEGVKK